MRKKSLIFQSAGTWFLAGLTFLLIISSCKKDDDNKTPASNTITDVVSSNSDFTILKAAVVKAGLATTLSGAGPFTVFAPNDAAFTATGITMNAVNNLM